MMTNLFMKVRPRIKFRLLILILLRISSFVAALPHSPVLVSVLAKTSRLSSSAPIHGPIFSSSVPGKKPISSPTLTVARVMMISEYLLSSSTCIRPEARANRVLPVPAVPVSVTKSISGSISILSAKFCSLLRAVTPHAAFLTWPKSLSVLKTAVFPRISVTRAYRLGSPGASK